MARLLVSVRSAGEAKRALAAGADVIDVKEPDQGSLGRAPFETWRDVRNVVAGAAPMSVALGELAEWSDQEIQGVPPGAFQGVSFCKIGLANAGPSWEPRWRRLISLLEQNDCRWIGVVYVDYETARAPDPRAVLEASIPLAGVLFDTWSKARPAVWTPEILETAAEIRRRGLILAVAGGLNEDSIPALAPLRPDLVAVRGAACSGGDRRAVIDTHQVARLAGVVSSLGA